MAKKKPKKLKVKYIYKPNPEMLEKGLEILAQDFKERHKEIIKLAKRPRNKKRK